MESLSYTLFSSMEVADATPKTIGAAEDNLHAYFEQFKKDSEEITGRLYAMIKKLTGEGTVNTEIKYLKVKVLDNPSQLVTRVSERVLEEILFNEKVCKYDEKQLNHPIAKKCCEEHLAAIKQLIDMEKSFKSVLSNAAKTVDKEDDKAAIKMLRNLKQVSKHLLWSSKRLLANIRMKSSNEELLPEWLSEEVITLDDSTLADSFESVLGDMFDKIKENAMHFDMTTFSVIRNPRSVVARTWKLVSQISTMLKKHPELESKVDKRAVAAMASAGYRLRDIAHNDTPRWALNDIKTDRENKQSLKLDEEHQAHSEKPGITSAYHIESDLSQVAGSLMAIGGAIHKLPTLDSFRTASDIEKSGSDKQKKELEKYLNLLARPVLIIAKNAIKIMKDLRVASQNKQVSKEELEEHPLA